jgi:hypothetical protein
MDRLPDPCFEPDPEWDAYVAWREREIAAGRCEQPPAVQETDGAAIVLSLGDAADLDPALLAAICGPEGLGGDGVGPQFGQGAAADVLRPSPVLGALTEATCDDLSRLTDNQLIGALQAARRLQNRYHYLQTLIIAEFARRRAEEFETAKARGVRVRCRPGEFPGVELAAELLVSGFAAGRLIDSATDLTTRLPRTLEGMSAGLIDAERGAIIAAYTGALSEDDAATVDEILAAAAPEIRADTLASRAQRLEMKLDPEAVRIRKEKTRRAAQRVQVQLERSGNASVAGRELDIADAMASKANIHATALRLRRAGLAGSLDHLRAGVFNDLLQGRNPLDRLAPVPDLPVADGPPDEADPCAGSDVSPDDPASGAESASAGGPLPPEAPMPASASGEWDCPDAILGDDWGDPDPASIGVWPRSGDGPGSDSDPDEAEPLDDEEDALASGAATVARTPTPAIVNLVVHAGTLFGWDTTPSQADRWGLLTPAETRDLVGAASMHPQSRWCMTVVGADGTAVAHGCSPGRHPWSPPPPEPKAPPPQSLLDGPHADKARQFFDFVRALHLKLAPIATGTCDHRHVENHYTPSRSLQHLVRARSATCTAPGCQAQASYSDLDHTTPYPQGPTDECNMGPKCRTHHRAKQTPGWQVEQPEPGVFRWTLPSGRAHTTRPGTY